MAKRKLRRQSVVWTDRGLEEGKIKVETPKFRALNTIAREVDRQNTPAGKVLNHPMMVDHPGAIVRLPTARHAAEPNNETLTTIIPCLRPGQAFRLAHPVDLDEHSSDGYPFQIVKEHMPRPWDVNYNADHEVIAKDGAMVLYLGPKRIDELMKKGNTVRQTRHFFIIGAGQYIILDLNLLLPLR